MRTTVVLNPNLLQEAKKYSRADSVSALVREALTEYVAARKSEDLLGLEGKVDIDPDWQSLENRELAAARRSGSASRRRRAKRTIIRKASNKS